MSETSSSQAAVGAAAGLGRRRLIDAARSALPVGSDRGRPRLRRLPPGLGLGAIAVLGAGAAALVAYEAANNPLAAPAHVAALVRILIIVILIAGGIYAQTSRIQMRMGALLVGAGLFSTVWLLNGSRGSLAFSIGALAAGAAPTVFACLMLAHPSGGVSRGIERRFILV